MVLGGMTHHCRWCGSAFTETKHRKIYCSKTCEDEAKYRNHWVEGEPLPGHLLEPEVRICKTCGRPFVTTHEGRRYCSDKCRYYPDDVKAEMEQRNGNMRGMPEERKVLRTR